MTAGLIPPGSPEFRARFRSFRESWFRLETLQRYGNSGEDDELAAFLTGPPSPPPRDRANEEWQDMIRSHVRAGRSMQRVHVVTEPLSDYLRYELTWAYGPHVIAGEDVRIIAVPDGQPWPAGLPALGTDYWLFDADELFHQHYDPTGWWLGTEPVHDPTRIERARAWREAALRQAVPWRDYMRRHEELSEYLPPDALES